MCCQHWTALALSRRADAAMLSSQLCMDSWLHWKQSLTLDLSAPLHGVRSTDIVIRRWEFIVVANERISAIVRQVNTRDSGRWHGVTGSKRISAWSRGWNLRRCLLDYETHLPDDYDCTWYSSYCLSRYAQASDGLGNILPRTTFQDW